MKIVLKNVSVDLGHKPILSNISMTCEGGEILCLLGPSGSGKTTLIRLMTGILKAKTGEIWMDTVRVPDKALLKHIGYMPQNEAIYTDLSGEDNLLFFGRLYGLSGRTLQDKAGKALQIVGLSEDRHKLTAHYSIGMRKRLSLAIALIHDPPILILDEPTVGIDPVLRKSIWNEFEALRFQGRTIIVSTHVMDEAERCQRAALIYGGTLIENDRVDVLKAKTQNGVLEELFFQYSKGGE